MDKTGLSQSELAAWIRLVTVVELLPGALDAQLRRDADLMHFEYFVLAILSEAPEHTLRMSALAAQTNSTPPRLSHVVRRLEDRGLVERIPSPADARSTNAHLTETGWEKVHQAAPGHAAAVRDNIIDALRPEQVGQLQEIADAILARLDPTGTMSATYRRYDQHQ
ncbi:MarR family winged helix-turn-helix transcriptional regulator [Nocardia callitridis]|uniref:MarR family winged helix-turn-helix transcriptional regulator n=1 Tax=Nocardia callitridis TaxID=648753 RepID=A0ABP9KAA3_9NOCA